MITFIKMIWGALTFLEMKKVAATVYDFIDRVLEEGL